MNWDLFGFLDLIIGILFLRFIYNGLYCRNTVIMRTIIFLPCFALVFFAGCGGSPSDSGFHLDFARPDVAPCERYGPARIDILPLTAPAQAPDSERDSILNVYICLLDSFDSQIKSPAVFRFELFEHAQRSTDPKGRRLTIWPDIALTDPALNNNHWQDFLRAYLFSLPVQKLSAGDYILHATCINSSGKRLYADFLIRAAR